MGNESHKEMLRSLHGLRGFACLAVVLSHYPIFRGSTGSNAICGLGELGVELFILLSGYLLCYRHWDDDIESFWHEDFLYAVHKIRKYYWLHLATLVCALPFWGLSMLRHPSFDVAVSLPVSVFLIQSFFPYQSIYFSLNMVAWYLSDVLFFLMISRFVIRFLKQFSFLQTLVMMVVIVLVEGLWALCVGECGVSKGTAHWLVYVCPFVRALDFVLGGGIYILSKGIWMRFGRKSQCILKGMSVLAYFNLIVFYSICQKDSWENGELFSVFAWTIPSVFLVLALACQENRNEAGFIFENRFFLFIGDISFELFLIHQLASRYAHVLFHKFPTLINESFLLVLALVLSILGAWKIHRRIRGE